MKFRPLHDRVLVRRVVQPERAQLPDARRAAGGAVGARAGLAVEEHRIDEVELDLAAAVTAPPVDRDDLVDDLLATDGPRRALRLLGSRFPGSASTARVERVRR